MKYYVLCTKATQWIAAVCSSQESAEKWIDNFNARFYTDKTLTKSDFKIEARKH